MKKAVKKEQKRRKKQDKNKRIKKRISGGSEMRKMKNKYQKKLLEQK